jgi:tricorn protease
MWDGGSIRMPASGAYTVDMENLERNGRRPTVEVLYDPNLWLQGRDAQLERAVQELLKRLS